MSCGAGSRWSWRGRSRGGYRRLRMPARTGFAQPRYPAVWPWAILATALRGLDRPLSFHIFGRGLRSHANSEAFTSERSFIAALKSLRHPEADSSGNAEVGSSADDNVVRGGGPKFWGGGYSS